jgi:hypothetical protein
MDPIPIYDNIANRIIEDAVNPLTGKKWNSEITIEDKKNIRKNMANEQINFYLTLFDKLLQRQKDSPNLTIIFANSIISKFYENHSFKNSEYGRLKNEITGLIETYRVSLKEKRVVIKNVFLGIVDTPMFTTRGDISAIRTKKIVAKLGSIIPLNGEEIIAESLLSPESVAEFLFEVGNRPSKETPDTYILFKEKHLDINNILKNYKKEKEIIVEKIFKLNISSEQKCIEISTAETDFIRQLRLDSLNIYIQQNKNISKQMSKKIINSNMRAMQRILDKLPQKVPYEMFVEISQRAERNYP